MWHLGSRCGVPQKVTNVGAHSLGQGRNGSENPQTDDTSVFFTVVMRWVLGCLMSAGPEGGPM